MLSRHPLSARAASELVLSHVAERSVLAGPDAGAQAPFEVAGRRRLATCSGVAWFRGDHLAVVNLWGGHARVYRFRENGASGSEARLELLHEMTQGLAAPEDVAVSPDGSLLAITHSKSDDHGVSIHRPDARTLALRAGDMVRRGRAFHGVGLSPDSRHLAFTDIGDPGHVEVVSLATPACRRTCRLENRDAPLKPKAVRFSRDGRYAAITKSRNATRKTPEGRPCGQLAVHACAADRGVIAERPLTLIASSEPALAYIEMCTFLPSEPGMPYHLLVTSPLTNEISSFFFDATRCTLTYAGAFASGLSFPHGMDSSADGRYVAVTNYGDDSLRIFRVAQDH